MLSTREGKHKWGVPKKAQELKSLDLISLANRYFFKLVPRRTVVNCLVSVPDKEQVIGNCQLIKLNPLATLYLSRDEPGLANPSGAYMGAALSAGVTQHSKLHFPRGLFHLT